MNYCNRRKQIKKLHERSETESHILYSSIYIPGHFPTQKSINQIIAPPQNQKGAPVPLTAACEECCDELAAVTTATYEDCKDELVAVVPETK